MKPKPSVVISIVVKIAGYAKSVILGSHRTRIDIAYLVIEGVEHIPRLEGKNKPHRVGHISDTAATHGLFANHADVDQHPEDKARTQFVERLDVEGTDGRVEFAADVELNVTQSATHAGTLADRSIRRRWGCHCYHRGQEERLDGKMRHRLQRLER